MGRPTLQARVGVSGIFYCLRSRADGTSVFHDGEGVHLSQVFCAELRGHRLFTLHPTSPPMVSLAGRSVPRQEKLPVPMVSPPCPPPLPFKFNRTCTAMPPHLSRHPILTSGLSNHVPLIQEGKPYFQILPEVRRRTWKLSPPAEPCSRYKRDGLGTQTCSGSIKIQIDLYFYLFVAV